MPILPRARRLAVRALDYAEHRLDAAVPHEDSGGATYNPMTGAGMGGVDKGRSARVNMSRVMLTDYELLRLYRLSGLTRRIVDIVPDYATRKKPVVLDAKGEPILVDEMDSLQALDAVRQAWVWARLIGGAYVLISTQDSGEKLREPLKRPAKITALTVLDGTEAQPMTYQTRIERPRYREPETYMLTPSGPGGSAGGLIVHHTRIVYIPGVLSPPSTRYREKTHDDSMIEALWTAIASKEGQGAAMDAMMQEASLTILTSPKIDASSASSNGPAYMSRMKYLAQARSYLSTIILGKGEEYQVVDRTFSGWSDLSQAAQTQISAETGYPAVILWGTAPGGMSSDDQSARRTMSAVVESEAEQRLVPAYRQVAEAMLPAGESVTVEIPSVDVPSPMEIADVELKNAQTYALYIDRQVLAHEQVAEGVFGPTKEIPWMPDELPDTETIDDTAPDLTGG